MENGLTISSKKSKVLTDIFLWLLGFFWVFPIIFVVIGALKTKQEYNLTSFWKMPDSFALIENIKYIFQYSDIVPGIINSILYGVVSSSLAIFLALIAAFAIAKLPIKGKMIWFFIIYSGTIFPFQIYLIPIFSAYDTLNLYDSRLGLMIFYMAISIPFSLFVLRNFFLGISNEIMESAKIDGSKDSTILFKIFTPMAKAPIAVLFLTQFAFCYNDLLFGITFAKSKSIQPIMAIISVFSSNKPAMMVAGIMVSIPTIVLYTLLNKNIDKGLSYQTK
ncbi:MAG: carbohydrate ABC transporter permease [Lachnospirales bacterium]